MRYLLYILVYVVLILFYIKLRKKTDLEDRNNLFIIFASMFIGLTAIVLLDISNNSFTIEEIVLPKIILPIIWTFD